MGTVVVVRTILGSLISLKMEDTYLSSIFFQAMKIVRPPSRSVANDAAAAVQTYLCAIVSHRNFVPSIPALNQSPTSRWKMNFDDGFVLKEPVPCSESEKLRMHLYMQA